MWAFGVLERDGEHRAVATVEPHNETQHYEVGRRLKAGGLTAVNKHDWNRFALALSRCSITVENGMFTEVHTGLTRMLADPPQPLSDRWIEVAKARRPALVIVPPGTMPSIGADRPVPLELLEHLPAAVDRLCEAKKLLAGFVTLLDAPAPKAGNGTHTLRTSEL